MRLNRALRMLRWTPLAAIAVAAACQHGDVNRLVALGGDTLILNVSLGTQGSGGIPAVTRTVSFISTAFDTAFGDAFNRAASSTAPTPASFGPAPSPQCSGGSYPVGSVAVIYPTTASVATYTPPNRYLPALFGSASLGDLSNCGQAVGFIIPGAHPVNGLGNTIWSFVYDLVGLTPNTRYVMGLARYAVTARGALDIPEILLTGAVTQPDTLVLAGGTLGGRKAAPAHVSCASPSVVRSDTLMNPVMIASEVSDGSGRVHFDQTACSDGSTAWANAINLTINNLAGTAIQLGTPVPNNRPGAVRRMQHNFLVVWEALADSTPNYARPVYRQQIGPLTVSTFTPIAANGSLTNTGYAAVNNSFAPIPTAQLTARQLGALFGSTSNVDSVVINASNLAPLSGAVYQVWFAKAGTDTAALATGRVYRILSNAIVDSVTSTNSFGGDTLTAFRMKIDYTPFATAGYNSVVLGIAPTGNTTYATVQPLWTTISSKTKGVAAPTATLSMQFGFFGNAGANQLAWAPAGGGTGGTFGTELTVQISHLPRPPVGYYYNGYMRNSTSGSRLDLGAIVSPYPDYSTLIDADVQATGTVNNREIVAAALRYTAGSDTELCGYDRVDVRLEPKSKVAGTMAPTVTITGTNPYPSLARCQP